MGAYVGIITDYFGIVGVRKGREPTRDFHYSKLGSERRETEYRSGGVTLHR